MLCADREGTRVPDWLSPLTSTMASNKTKVMSWLKKLLRPYLEDRLRMLVATDAAEALSGTCT
jgi:hypothetical protein